MPEKFQKFSRLGGGGGGGGGVAASLAPPAGKTIDEVSAALNQSLKELYAWCVRNRLTPHPKKSECIIIYRASFTGPLPPIYLGGNNLECRGNTQSTSGRDYRPQAWLVHSY